MSPAHEISVSVLNSSKRDADRMRAQWRVALTTQAATIPQLLRAACADAGAPLLRLRLADVLVASGEAVASVNRVLARLRAENGVAPEVANRDLTVAWLLDPRARAGARMTSFADALATGHGSRLALVEATGWPYRAVV